MKRDRRGFLLEVTYRGGQPWAAYLQLPGNSGQRAYCSRREERGLIVDLARDGKPLGIEITAPGLVSLTAVNRLLKRLGAPTITKADFGPLLAA